MEGEGRMRTRDGGMETIGRDGSETGQLMKKKGKQKHRRPVIGCQPHQGLQGYRGE